MRPGDVLLLAAPLSPSHLALVGEFAGALEQPFMDPARFVFLDETATTTDRARRYRRSPSEARLVGAVPQGPSQPARAAVREARGLRQLAAPTRDELWQAIGRLLAAVSAGECANYLRHCGHGST